MSKKKLTIYRFLTGPDDAAFCRRVTEALNEGWELHGSPALSYDSKAGKVMCGQAVTKCIKDAVYDPERKLSDY